MSHQSGPAHRAISLLVGLLAVATACHAGETPKAGVISGGQVNERHETATPRGYVCYRAAEPPALSARLDEVAWRGVPWTDEFVDIEGDIRPRPRFRTHAKMLWDDKYLYIGAELEEPHVWATLTEHDSVIYHDNDFEVFIDPDGDNHDYYEIEINALNTEWDLRLVKPYRDGGPALNSWEIPGFRSTVRVDGTLNDPRDTDRGWSVEMALPWAVLAEFAGRPSPPAPGDQWRINFSRVEWDVTTEGGQYHKIPNRPEHNWVWSPQGAIDMHRPEHWGYVQFSRDPLGTTVFRPDPSGPARALLMDLYEAQHEFQRAHGHWAGTLTDLRPLAMHGLVTPPQMLVTPDGFTATVEYSGADGRPHPIHVRTDSRLWEE